MSERSWLKKLAQDTISRSASIVAEHAAQDASADSVFVEDQLPQLDQAASPNHSPNAVEIVNLDAFSLARRVLVAEPTAKVAVLNLASFLLPAGPWLQVYTKTQEEALCYSSTLYITLKPEYYPWPNTGPGCAAGIYSPGVVIFRDDLDHRCEELSMDDRRVVSVLTVAAPAWADLTEDETAFADPEVLGWLREKIRLVYRMAAHNGQDYLVLGAMGCGAYECPPELVAREMREILREAEFRGWFKKVVFAVYSTAENGEGNFGIFSEVLSTTMLRRLFTGKPQEHEIPLSKDSRRAIAHETIKLSPSIVKKHAAQGASAGSTFHTQQLLPLDPAACPNHAPAAVHIINSDAFVLARTFITDDPAAKVAVLNLASFILPGGPWLELLTTTQEEALCYTSTLYITLKPEYYPWPNLGPESVVGIYSPGVVIFRTDLDTGCRIMSAPDRCVVSVVTVSAPAQAPLTPDGEAFEDPATLEHFREKIRLVYRMAAQNGQDHLILGAMGCGAYKCPPRLVAKEMRDILCEQEFRGWFKKVAFAIYSRSSPPNNHSIFQEAFQGVQV